MTNKRNIILAVIFLLVLPLAVYIYYKNKISESDAVLDVMESNQETVGVQTDITMKQKNQLSGSKEKTISSNEEVNISTEKEPGEKPDEFTAQQWFFITSVHDAFKRADVPIVFYGQVLDQNNNPVVGADIKISATYYAGFSLKRLMKDDYYKTHELNLTTDNGGIFIVDGLKGRSLDISISKEGYIVSESEFHYVYDPQHRRQHKPDADAPVIFPLWKKSGGAELLTSQANLRITDEDPNKTYSISLLNNQIFTGIDEQGDIIVEVFNEGRGYDKETNQWVEKRDKYEWSVKISMPNGGFVETSDLYLYQAPASGYQSMITFGASRDAPDWAPDINEGRHSNFGKKYYFRDKKGRFGSLRLEIKAFASGKVFVGFKEVTLNPTGSRNLEPLVDSE